jgi:hypothetical protein
VLGGSDKRSAPLRSKWHVSDKGIETKLQLRRLCPKRLGAKLEILSDGEIAVQAEILRHIPDAAPLPPGLWFPKQADLTFRRREQTKDHPDQRCLARPIGPDQSYNLTGFDLDIDRVDGSEAAKPPGNSCG